MLAGAVMSAMKELIIRPSKDKAHVEAGKLSDRIYRETGRGHRWDAERARLAGQRGGAATTAKRRAAREAAKAS